MIRFLLCFFFFFYLLFFFFFQAEDGIRDLVRSRGLGDVYKRQGQLIPPHQLPQIPRQSPQLQQLPQQSSQHM